MKMKNDCQIDYIKEAFDKLYNRVMPFIDLTQFSDADTAFKELDKKVHSEIYILKKCLAERDRAVDAGLTRSEVDRKRISELEQRLNNECKHGEDLADINCRLASENVDLKAKVTLLETSRITWRSRAQHAEKAVTLADINCRLASENVDLKAKVTDLNKKVSDLEKELAESRNSNELLLRKENDRLREVIDGNEKEINSLKKKIHELEQDNEALRSKLEAVDKAYDALRRDNKILWSKIKNVERSNVILRGDNETLWARLIECDLDIFKRPWHGDGNAMTGAQTCYKSLVETIEFQNKKIEELEAEKARLKEAYDIHETTIKKENVDLSYGHEFEFGDEVFVPWSDEPYMYVKSGMMYNPRTERLVYVGKDQHLKWFGEKFSIV